MKKVVLSIVFLLISLASSAQFKFADEAYKAPKGALNLNKIKAGSTAKLKKGQLAYYTWVGKENEHFGQGTDDLDGNYLKSKETYIYEDEKSGTKYVTFQWIGKNEGKVKITIETNNDEKNAKIILVEVK